MKHSERRYIHFGRGLGHTQAMLNGAKNADNVVIVAHTQQFADDLAKQCKNARGVGLDRTERLLGSHLPIVVDHYAIEILLGERERRISKLKAAESKAQYTADAWADRAHKAEKANTSASAIMQKFVDKVDRGMARSTETYAEMKEWLDD